MPNRPARPGWRLGARRLVVLVLAMALVGASCSDGDDPSAEPATTEPAGPVVAPSSVGDEYVATIERTSHGVAHVTAADLGSLGFGQGYALAEDHACTLFDQVTKVRSERSLYLGPGEGGANVDSDLAYLALGVYEHAIDRWSSLDGDLADVVDGYAAGVNTWLEQTGADAVPGWCAGAPWVHPITPVDLLAYYEDLALVHGGRMLIEAIATAQPPGSPPLDRGDAGASPAEGPGTATTPGTAVAEPTSTTTIAGGAPAPVAAARSATASSTADGAGSVGEASTGWAIGARGSGAGGMLVAEPDLPWEGELRLWESHLSVPGVLDVYGASPIGAPGVLVGFNDAVAFTPAAAGGQRGTAYQLELEPGDPTRYRVDGQTMAMTSHRFSIQVARGDGTTGTIERTLWRTADGPVVDLPGMGWTDATAVAYRDANADNVRWLDLVLRLDRADGLEAVQAAHAELGGLPWSATVVASADGRAWFADGAPTPNLDPAVLGDERLIRGPEAGAPSDGAAGLVVLDGATSSTRWIDAPGAPAPGLVPFAEAPQLERDDWVAASGDGHWLVNPDQPIVGRPPLFGPEVAALSPRGRQVLDLVDQLTATTSPSSPLAVEDLEAAALDTESATGRLLRDEVVARCRRADDVVAVPAGPPTATGAPLWEAQDVHLEPACEALAGWDETFGLDARGAVLWRELLARLGGDELWRVPFREGDPRNTPRGLAREPDQGPDPVLVHLGEALLALRAAGVEPGAALREVQWVDRGGERLPIPGGSDGDGTVLQAGRSVGSTSLEPPMVPSAPLTDSSWLAEGGYPVSGGTSYVLVVAFGDDGPRADALLVHGESGDPAAPFFADQTYRYSDGAWRPALFTDEQIATDPNLTELVVRGPRTQR